MFLTDLSIKRPVVASVMSIVLVIFGIVTFQEMILWSPSTNILIIQKYALDISLLILESTLWPTSLQGYMKLMIESILKFMLSPMGLIPMMR